MTYLDAYPGCLGCPVSKWCGTAVSCYRLCNSYQTSQQQNTLIQIQQWTKKVWLCTVQTISALRISSVLDIPVTTSLQVLRLYADLIVIEMDITTLYHWKMAKFKKGDRCRVIKNALAPDSVGDIVTIDSIAFQTDSSILYRIEYADMTGYASEKCLELVDNTNPWGQSLTHIVILFYPYLIISIVLKRLVCLWRHSYIF